MPDFPAHLASIVQGRKDGGPVSLAIVTASGEVSCHVDGHWPSGRRVTPDDMFYGASLAKQVTGAAIAVLVRRGLLDVDAQVASILPEAARWAGPVTVRQLLHHIGGMPEQGVLEAGLSGTDWTNAWVMGRISQGGPPSRPAGSAHAYSNAGYTVLARIVEEVCALSFPALVTSDVLSPLGLAGLTFSSRPGTPASEQWSMLGRSLPLSTGDGGLWTTAAAFALWLDGQNRDRLRVESLVTRPGRLLDGTTTGYGWGIGLRGTAETPVYVHGGTWPGAAAKAIRCPGIGLSVVGLGAGDGAETVIGLVDSVFAALGGMA